ncbi:hypothetical protein SUGI_0550040 [Cryptomeria japonica]|nr:hypothetical protein SUGI_0550040 [Cryptomeria japonica]
MVKVVKIVIQISTHRRINGIGGNKKINFIQSMDNYAGRGSSSGSIVSTRGERPSIDFNGLSMASYHVEKMPYSHSEDLAYCRRINRIGGIENIKVYAGEAGSKTGLDNDV